MRLFTRNKDVAVQSLIVKLINNNCADVDALYEGPRVERRVNLTEVVHLVPVENKSPAIGRACTAVTKEFSSTGTSVVVREAFPEDEMFLGLQLEGETKWVRAKAKHLRPMGGGFHLLGLRLTEVIHVGDYPQLGLLHW
jgi:hypothetical protein